jgi:hypothetical protein
MRQSVFQLFICLAAAFLFGSCEKVINVDLNTADPKIVIEGSITDQPGPYTIRVTQSVNFDEPNTFPPVSGAVVTLSDDAGNVETLTETDEPGLYATNAIQGVPGRTYTLTVSTGEDTYTAVSTMPQPVEMDALLTEEFSGPHGGGKMVQARYTDPAGIANFYRFILYINHVEELILIANDRLQDGEVTTIPVFSQPDQGLAVSGDTAVVYMQTIDEGVYEYFRTLDQMSGGQHGGAVSTANPRSNINNGALGYFSACAIRSKTITVE